MMIIRVNVTGEGPVDKVGRNIRDGLKDSMGATPWKLTVTTDEGDVTRYINEGRRG